MHTFLWFNQLTYFNVTERVRLENLESTEYEVVMTSYGMNTSSSEYKFEFDMACASITADILVLIDTSTFV